MAQLRILVEEHRELLRKIQRDEMEEGEVRTYIYLNLKNVLYVFCLDYYCMLFIIYY